MSPTNFCLLFTIFTLIIHSFGTPSSSPADHTLFNPKLFRSTAAFSSSKRFEGSSKFVQLRYLMGPVLSQKIRMHIIWYGKWDLSQKLLIKDFINSISTPSPPPSVFQWWRTATLYGDQTGANVSNSVTISGEYSDTKYSSGKQLTRLSVQYIIRDAILSSYRNMSTIKRSSSTVKHDTSNIKQSNSTVKQRFNRRGTMYLVLTSTDVMMQDFCRAVCGFHYFTFPSVVGFTSPYAWVGNAATQCPDVCAYPFAIPSYMSGVQALGAPNQNVGLDGMISVIGHEIAEVATNPLINAWYAGEDPLAPTEIADLCEGLYGTGGGGGYMGIVMKDRDGATFNMIGVKKRRFLLQWIWSPVLNACRGPNAKD